MKFLAFAFVVFFSMSGFSAVTPFDGIINEFKNAPPIVKHLEPIFLSGVCFNKDKPSVPLNTFLVGNIISDGGPAFGNQDYRFHVFSAEMGGRSVPEYLNLLHGFLKDDYSPVRYLGGSAVSIVNSKNRVYLRYSNTIIPGKSTQVVLMTTLDSNGRPFIVNSCYFFGK